ncbi:MAG: GGDEF domain-containing response regulator [Thermodesulfobacteriota bacterium]
MQILIAEDDPASRVMLQNMLQKWGYEVIAVEDGPQAWEVLQAEEPPQIAILDWMMPEPDGPQICRLVREKLAPRVDCEQNPECLSLDQPGYIYLILLSAKADKEHLVQGLEAGADDYIPKPFNAEELQARLRVGHRIIDLQTRLLNTQAQLQQLARIDHLTCSYNRRAILELLKQELDRAKRENSQLSLAMLDIDHFKSINDQFGHQIGDLVLQECVRRTEEVLRRYDLLGRFGGEEFLLVLPNTNLNQAKKICTRVKENISNKPIKAQGQEISCTVSLGVSTWQGEISLDQLIMQVDAAMYKAKDDGRNKVCNS